MIIGRVYEFVDKNKKFPFDYERGAFIGYTPQNMPRFMLNVRRGAQCFINATDEMFEEVVYDKNKLTPEKLKKNYGIEPQEADMI